ncbi:hypothetical protein [Streptomyces sp. NPDC059611]|uniref:hypothetical protein n=1 Tax=Streptomyces sp. NPDC059611 TaxID=3346884 RepID=UPI0036B956A5
MVMVESREPSAPGGLRRHLGPQPRQASVCFFLHSGNARPVHEDDALELVGQSVGRRCGDCSGEQVAGAWLVAAQEADLAGGDELDDVLLRCDAGGRRWCRFLGTMYGEVCAAGPEEASELDLVERDRIAQAGVVDLVEHRPGLARRVVEERREERRVAQSAGCSREEGSTAARLVRSGAPRFPMLPGFSTEDRRRVSSSTELGIRPSSFRPARLAEAAGRAPASTPQVVAR